MQPRFSMSIALAVLLAAGLACSMPVAMTHNPTERMLVIDSLSVSPRESDGKTALTLSYAYTQGTLPTTISCSITTPSGAEKRIGDYKVDGSDEESSSTANIPFGASEVGNYSAHCWDTSGPASESSAFSISAPAQPATIQPAAQTGGSNPACQWVVDGTWQVTQVNGYHPVFVIQQQGSALIGTATLTDAEASMGGYSGTLGNGQGSVTGDQFSFSVTWPPQVSNGKVITGVYSGVITQGKISEPDGVWSATGTSQCVNP
jgi:hypothetical protein